MMVATSAPSAPGTPSASNIVSEATVPPDHATEDRTWIRNALIADMVIVLVTWILLHLGNQGRQIVPIGQVPVLGAALMLVAFITFGGFYLASPATATSRDPWMRNAIAASFVMYYLFLLSLWLIAPHLRVSESEAPAAVVAAGTNGAATAEVDRPFGEEIFIGFTTFVGIVLGFYFATQAAERIAETVQSGQTTRAAIERQPELAQQIVNEQRIATRKGGPPF